MDSLEVVTAFAPRHRSVSVRRKVAGTLRMEPPRLGNGDKVSQLIAIYLRKGTTARYAPTPARYAANGAAARRCKSVGDFVAFLY